MYIYNNTSLINTNKLMTINNQIIECVNKYKCLGIHIDNKLKYNKNIMELKKNISKLIYIFKKMSFIIENNTLLPLYNSLIVTNYMYLLSDNLENKL